MGRERSARVPEGSPSDGHQRTVLRLLYHSPSAGLSTEALLKALKIDDAQQAGGIFSGLAKNAKKLGLKFPLTIEKNSRRIGRRSDRTRLTQAF